MPAITALLMSLSLALAPVAGAASPDADPAVMIRSGPQERRFARSELLKRSDSAPLSVPHDPSYGGKPREYPHAIPLRALFQGVDVPSGSIVQFECTDGFSAPLSRDHLLGEGKAEEAIPYLAVEAPGESWGPTAGGKITGPYYLVWKHPEKSGIGVEQWPFALASLTVKASIEASYPKILPAKGAPKDGPVRRGFQAFVKSCFACHTINREGQSQLGPDLNVPMNPTEYLSEANLKRLIRNPQDLRSWPQAKMTGFSRSALPDAELADLLAYLRHMAGHKRDRSP